MTPPVAPSGEQLELSFGEQRAVVVEVGAGLRAYAVGGREVLDGYPADEMCASGRGQVLMPWPNRIEDGSYEFDGRRHQLPLTEVERGQRDPRPRPLGELDGRGARAAPGRAGAPAPPAAGLSLRARPAHRVLAR